MTDETFRQVIVAGLTALPPTLVGLGTLVQSMLNGKASGDLKTQINHNTDRLAAKSDIIHDSTNGNLQAVKDKLAVAVDRIAVLESYIQELRDAWLKQPPGSPQNPPPPI